MKYKSLFRQAFTLIELLVVVAIIGILAALLLPALSRAKTQAQTRACNNDLRTLSLACLMYTHDNSSHLVSSWPLGWDSYEANPYSWCPGWASTVQPENPLYGSWPNYSPTNIYALQHGAIWPYVGSAKAYLCPADNRSLNGIPVTRSYSMNSWVNGRSMDDPSGEGSSYRTPELDAGLTDTLFRKEIDIRKPGSTWVLIDEDGASINDSLFLVDMGPQNTIYDLPTTRHGAVYDLEFADGHVENVRWLMSPSAWDDGDGPEKDWQTLTNWTTFPR